MIDFIWHFTSLFSWVWWNWITFVPKCNKIVLFVTVYFHELCNISSALCVASRCELQWADRNPVAGLSAFNTARAGSDRQQQPHVRAQNTQPLQVRRYKQQSSVWDTQNIMQLMNINTFWYSHRPRWLIDFCVFCLYLLHLCVSSSLPVTSVLWSWTRSQPWPQETHRAHPPCGIMVTLRCVGRETSEQNLRTWDSQIRKRWVCLSVLVEGSPNQRIELFCRLPSPTYNSLLYIEDILKKKQSNASRNNHFQSISIQFFNAVKSISD